MSTALHDFLKALAASRWTGTLLLVALCGIITILQSAYVGDLTIYSTELAERRHTVHERILTNTPSEIGWKFDGTNGVNTRILTVYTVDWLSNATGQDVLRLYKALDIVSLFVTLLLSYYFLRKWFEPEYALLGVLYWGTVLPLTYAFHAFHPWDRIGALMWLLSLWAIESDKRIAFAALLAIGTAIKYDIIVLPGLYFLVWASRANLISMVARSALFAAIGAGVYIGLLILQPDGVGEGDPQWQMARNLQIILQSPLTFAPLLGFGVLLPLCVLGVPHANRFLIAAASFGIALFVPFFVLSNVEEFRAHTVILLLVLPLALAGARAVLVNVRGAQDEAGSANVRRTLRTGD